MTKENCYIKFNIEKSTMILLLQAPEPVEPWSETLDAFEHMPTCVHVSSPPFSDVSPQSEDCLALNINVPGKFNFAS